MVNEKKNYVAPQYKVVEFNALDVIATESGVSCMEIHSWLSGTDCHDQEMYLPQGN